MFCQGRYLKKYGSRFVERKKIIVTFALKNTALGGLNKKINENFFLYLKSYNFAARKLKSQAN